MDKYSVVDLFAGAGGLSLGFEQTNKYDVKVAFENSPYMQDTYKKNHPDVEVLGDVCQADYGEIQEKYGAIDVVIGGPPCQGFSNANRQRNHAVSQNNMLVKQYIRAVLELQPKAFIMENVSMLHSDIHRFYLDDADKSVVEKYAVPTKETALHLLDKELIFEGVAELIGDRSKVERYLWSEAHYAEMNIIYKAAKNPKKMQNALEKHKKKLLKIAEEHTRDITDDNSIHIEDEKAFRAIQDYFGGNVLIDAIQELIEPAIMFQRMLSKAEEIFVNNLAVERYSTENGLAAIIRSYAVFDYLKAILESDANGYVISSKVLSAADYGAPQKRMRFVVMGIKKSISSMAVLPKGRLEEDEYLTVHDAISDLEDVEPVFEIEKDTGIPLLHKELGGLAGALRDSEVLRNHIVTKTTNTAMERFQALKQGQNFHALDKKLKENTYTDASRTQNTIYLRLKYDDPCGTVVNVRKSMWIHPTLDRAISVREAARLQTFPDSYVFCGSKDKQYQQVGNAVPPIMAKSIAKKLASLLKKGLEKEASIDG